jgi:glycine hydroxymethyltransferase
MGASIIQEYIEKLPRGAALDPGALAYLANLETVARTDAETARGIVSELRDQRRNLKLIASENFSSLAVQAAMGNLLTDKYAEGTPPTPEGGGRYYAGCDNVDAIESLAASRAKTLFGAEHAYVQPHSGADANLVALYAILRERIEIPALSAIKKRTTPEWDGKRLSNDDWAKLRHEQWEPIRVALGQQRLLGMSLGDGGHLTHGYRLNASARMFDALQYGVAADGLIDYDALRRQAREIGPLVIIAGYSAYPRRINFRVMREIADECGAVLMVDMAHFSGLVAGKVFAGEFDPVAYADIVTTTTHKTLRGPRGGMVLCRKKYAEHVDKGCPMIQGGPLPHVMAAKAVCFLEAGRPEFRDYAAKVVENARALAAGLVKRGFELLTGGTDNHLMVVKLTSRGLTGAQGDAVLRECGITVNKNAVPRDENTPMITSGLRLGTPAMTTLGMGAAEMDEIADIIDYAVTNTRPGLTEAGKPSKQKYTIGDDVKRTARERVAALLGRHPLYPGIDQDLLERHFGPRSPDRVTPAALKDSR